MQVAESKILGYLLAAEHPTGGDKAAFFDALGYERSDWTRLRDDLISTAREGDLVSEEETRFGVKSVVDGTLFTPRGQRIALRTVWIRDRPADALRLVTAYPKKGGTGDVQGA